MTTGPNSRHVPKTLALAAIVVIATVGCSSNKDSDAAPTTTSPGVTTTSAATSTTSAAPLTRYADYESANYSDDAHWLCRPGRSDICSGDLDSTTIEADGTLTVHPFTRAKQPKIDCFYVYPTISRDSAPTSDWNASDQEEGYAAFNQVAPLGSQCRVFAPIYRQRTLAGLVAGIGGTNQPAGAPSDPYADVVDAWKTYMANDNDGRGVVLVGHSQGAGLLKQLIINEIDPNPEVRAILVSAYLAGTAVVVPDGKDVGGDLKNIPLCRAHDTAGCVVTWSSFRSTAPPVEGAYFGRPRKDAAGATDGVAGCTNPASLSGGSADADNLFPASRKGSILAPDSSPTAATDSPWISNPTKPITTPLVSLTGLVSTECATDNGFNYLKVTVHGNPKDSRADDIGGDLSPEWGLHLVDMNLVMGDMIKLVANQSAAWATTR